MVLSRHVGHIEIYKKKIISERQRIFHAKQEAKINNVPESSISLKKYQSLVAELYLLLDYVCDTPFTHPADSIIGVKKYSDDCYGLAVDQSNYFSMDMGITLSLRREQIESSC